MGRLKEAVPHYLSNHPAIRQVQQMKIVERRKEIKKICFQALKLRLEGRSVLNLLLIGQIYKNKIAHNKQKVFPKYNSQNMH